MSESETRHEPHLDEFHVVCRSLDYREPLEALLEEFRRGTIADQDRAHEDAAVRAHLTPQRVAWDRVFPPFPEHPWKRRTIVWEHHRGERDVYLRSILVRYLRNGAHRSHTIVNPASVFGRHARAIARALPECMVIGADIVPTYELLYRLVSWWTHPALSNYRFVRDNIFESKLECHPVAVTFYGACGAVTDGCLDYAIHAQSPFLLCRTCCHENIGGNTVVARRPGHLNRFFRWKNRLSARIKKWDNGMYFSQRYSKDAYPRSSAARRIMDADTIIAIAQNSVDSDICRSIIDLDRCLYLQEHGYDVLYREELIFAHRRR